MGGEVHKRKILLKYLGEKKPSRNRKVSLKLAGRWKNSTYGTGLKRQREARRRRGRSRGGGGGGGVLSYPAAASKKTSSSKGMPPARKGIRL